MIAARKEGQNKWFQLYVNRDKKVTEEVIRKAEKRRNESIIYHS